MARFPKPNKDAYKEILFGINRLTLKVEEVWLTHGNQLSSSPSAGEFRTKQIPYGMRPWEAAGFYFDLGDVLIIPVNLRDSEHSKYQIMELEAKVLKMREDAPRV